MAEQKYIRTEYEDGSAVLSNLRSVYSNESYTSTKVTTYNDGTPMDDSKCDGVIYRRLGEEYFKRNFDGNLFVEWFGAKGDGVTDDSDAIQKAIDVCNDLGGGEVELSGKTYMVGSTITVKTSVTLKGCSDNVTYTGDPLNAMLKALPSLGDTPIVSAGDGVDHRRNINVRGVSFDGSFITSVCLFVSDVIQSNISGCWFSSTTDGGAGIRGGGCLYLYITKCAFNATLKMYAIDLLNSYAYNPDAHYYGVNVGSIRDCTVNVGFGIRVEGICDIVNNDFELTPEGIAVIDIASPSFNSYVNILNNYFELPGFREWVAPVAIRVRNGQANIQRNMIYGGGASIPGSTAIKCDEVTFGLVVQNNGITRFQTGIALTSSTDGAGENVGLNTVFGNNITDTQEMITYGKNKTNGIGSTDDMRHSSQFISTRRFHAFTNAVILEPVESLYTVTNELNLFIGNYFHFQDSGVFSITNVTNKKPGLVFRITTLSNNVCTLPYSVFKNKSGGDITLTNQEVRSYLVCFDGTIREVGGEQTSSKTLKYTLTSDALGNINLSGQPGMPATGIRATAKTAYIGDTDYSQSLTYNPTTQVLSTGFSVATTFDITITF